MEGGARTCLGCMFLRILTSKESNTDDHDRCLVHSQSTPENSTFSHHAFRWTVSPQCPAGQSSCEIIINYVYQCHLPTITNLTGAGSLHLLMMVSYLGRKSNQTHLATFWSHFRMLGNDKSPELGYYRVKTRTQQNSVDGSTFAQLKDGRCCNTRLFSVLYLLLLLPPMLQWKPTDHAFA